MVILQCPCLPKPFSKLNIYFFTLSFQYEKISKIKVIRDLNRKTIYYNHTVTLILVGELGSSIYFVFIRLLAPIEATSNALANYDRYFRVITTL